MITLTPLMPTQGARDVKRYRERKRAERLEAYAARISEDIPTIENPPILEDKDTPDNES